MTWVRRLRLEFAPAGSQFTCFTHTSTKSTNTDEFAPNDIISLISTAPADETEEEEEEEEDRGRKKRRIDGEGGKKKKKKGGNRKKDEEEGEE